MSAHDSDGIDEALQGVTHVAMTAAARIGEQLARLREQQARDAQARSEHAAREHAARMTAEREAARATFSPVARPEWWDSATAEEVTRAYATAKAWSDVDPAAARAEQRIIEEVRGRYGVDLAREGESPNVVEAIDRADHARARAAEERTGARGDRAEAVALLAAADASDRVEEVPGIDRWIAEVEADIADLARRLSASDSQDDHDPLEDALHAKQDELTVLVTERGRADEEKPGQETREHAAHAYDSAERREAMAHGFDHVENRAAVDARVRSDVAQARPATDAVTNEQGRVPRARKARPGTLAGRKAQRPGQSR
ncbi:MAG: hypothetical protein R2722_16285 [Tessaracoccus sp.]